MIKGFYVVNRASNCLTAATFTRAFSRMMGGLEFGPHHRAHGEVMTICPVAIAVGCKKCPIFPLCPAKSVIGDYPGNEPVAPDSAGSESEDEDQV